MKTLAYIVLTVGVMAAVLVLGFAGDRFRPFRFIWTNRLPMP